MLYFYNYFLESLLQSQISGSKCLVILKDLKFVFLSGPAGMLYQRKLSQIIVKCASPICQLPQTYILFFSLRTIIFYEGQ